MYQLKNLLTTLLFSLIANALCAQADLCDNCYVWEFTTDKGERNETTRLLSNDIEDILSSYPACKVVQRSRFAKLQEQINNEKAIQSLNGASAASKAEFKATQAKRVIFGEVNRDFTGNVSLRLSFENLTNTNIRTNTVFLIGEEYYNFEKRKQKLTALVNAFINPDGKMQTPLSPTGGGGSTNEPQKACDPQTAPYTIESDGMVVTFCKCYYFSNKVVCPLWVVNKNKEIRELAFSVIDCRLIIDYGTPYMASSGKIMNNTNGNICCVGANVPPTRNGVPASITFESVKTNTKIIESLEIMGKSFFDVPLVHGPPPAR